MINGVPIQVFALLAHDGAVILAYAGVLPISVLQVATIDEPMRERVNCAECCAMPTKDQVFKRLSKKAKKGLRATTRRSWLLDQSLRPAPMTSIASFPSR